MGSRGEAQEVIVPTEQAKVQFYGHELIAASLPDGRIVAILRWLCEGMGIDVQAQLRRIQRKAALRNELLMVRVQTDGGPQSMPALDLHGLPGWLYSIDETRLANPEAQQGVILFQREATDVLYRHFSQHRQRVAAPTSLVPAEPMIQPNAPATGAPPEEWIAYHRQMVAFLEWQTDIEQWRGRIESRLESIEEVTRLVPELLERLGPQTLSPAHQASVQAVAKRLHELAGIAYATIYGELNQAFHVGRYSDILESQWTDVAAWLKTRIDTAAKTHGATDIVSAPLFPSEE